MYLSIIELLTACGFHGVVMEGSVSGLEDLSYTSNLSPAYELSSEDVDM
jgi:hypothetical protein